METQQAELPKQPMVIQGDAVAIPARQMPGYRTWKAIQAGVERNLLFRTWGGLGDQICAEPTIRYAFSAFKDCQISLASEQPDLYRHLNFKRVFNLKEEQPIWKSIFSLTRSSLPLASRGSSSLTVSQIVWTSPRWCALRCQLPCKDREIHLAPRKAKQQHCSVG